MITVTFFLGCLVIGVWYATEAETEPPVCGTCGRFDCPRATSRDEDWGDPLDDPTMRGREEDRYLNGLIGEGR